MTYNGIEQSQYIHYNTSHCYNNIQTGRTADQQDSTPARRQVDQLTSRTADQQTSRTADPHNYRIDQAG